MSNLSKATFFMMKSFKIMHYGRHLISTLYGRTKLHVDRCEWEAFADNKNNIAVIMKSEIK